MLQRLHTGDTAGSSCGRSLVSVFSIVSCGLKTAVYSILDRFKSLEVDR